MGTFVGFYICFFFVVVLDFLWFLSSFGVLFCFGCCCLLVVVNFSCVVDLWLFIFVFVAVDVVVGCLLLFLVFWGSFFWPVHQKQKIKHNV